MISELAKDSGERPSVITTDTIREEYDAYLNKLAQLDRYDATGHVENDAPGLTTSLLSYVELFTYSLPEGTHLPLIPLDTPTHQPNKLLNRVLKRIVNPRLFSKYRCSYFDPSSSSVYTISNPVDTIAQANAKFLPEGNEFYNVSSFITAVKKNLVLARGNSWYDDVAKTYNYADHNFKVMAVLIDGEQSLLTTLEIGKILEALDTVADGIPLSEDINNAGEALHRRLSAVRMKQSILDKEYRTGIKGRIYAIVRDQARFPYQIREQSTGEVFRGKPVYFYPIAGDFITQDRQPISDEAYMSMVPEAIDYLERHHIGLD